jgi:hypothetical protein
MSALKRESKLGTKVTCVTEVSYEGGTAMFEGDVFMRERVKDRGFTLTTGKFSKLGRYYVIMEVRKDGSLGAHVNGGKL